MGRAELFVLRSFRNPLRMECSGKACGSDRKLEFGVRVVQSEKPGIVSDWCLGVPGGA
jgi:hypothetical protein